MATWVSHLIIADKILARTKGICPREFCVGNIAPDCNIENEDFTSFTPSREVTHWMQAEYKQLSDAEKFLDEYVKTKENISREETSFLLGYYTHLVTDAEFRSFTHNEQRLAASWERIISEKALYPEYLIVPQNWDGIKLLIPKRERMKDIYNIEKKYLDKNPESGYFKYIRAFKDIPDYIDYLPQGAIARKIKIMGYMPRAEKGKFLGIVITEEEYDAFLKNTAAKASERITEYLNNFCHHFPIPT